MSNTVQDQITVDTAEGTAAERLTVALAAVEEAEREAAQLADRLTSAADAGDANEVMNWRGAHVAVQVRVGEAREAALEAEIEAEREAADVDQQADRAMADQVIALRRAAADRVEPDGSIVPVRRIRDPDRPLHLVGWEPVTAPGEYGKG